MKNCREKKYNEIRLDTKGSLDDIAIYDMHLERMDTKTWWLSYNKGKDRICFMFRSKKKIDLSLYEYGLKTEIVKSDRLEEK